MGKMSVRRGDGFVGFEMRYWEVGDKMNVEY